MEPPARQLLTQLIVTSAKAFTFMLTVLTVTLLGLPTSAQATLLTFTFSGEFEDVHTGGDPNTIFNTFSGTYTYDESSLDEDPQTGRGLYTLSDFSVLIFDKNNDLSGEICTSGGWIGQLELKELGNFEACEEYSITFGKDQPWGGISPGPQFLRISWNWFLDADIVPTVAPTSPVLPGSSFLRVALGGGPNQYYIVSDANVQPVPEPTTIFISSLGLFGMGAYIRRRQALE